MGEFVKWPSIEGFHNVYRHNAKLLTGNEVVSYRAKVKLHGTNAAIRIDPDGTVTAQKRSSDITPEADNFGFAAWVEANRDAFRLYPADEPIVIYGEWAGPGIQKSVAVSKIEKPAFFVFAIYYTETDRLVSDPWSISNLLSFKACRAVQVIPYFGEYRIDFGDEVGVRIAVERINVDVDGIDKVDPLIKDLYGIEGHGEGLVFFPEPICTMERFATMAFKSKGGSHKVVKDAKPAKVETWTTGNHREFVDQFMSENRLEQGLQEACGGVASMRGAADFLKWVGGDVKKESVDELEASGLEWQHIAKMVNLVAITWFKKRVAGLPTAANSNAEESEAA